MEVETKYIRKDGTPVTPGVCVIPEVYTTTFTVIIRSMFPVSEETVKGLITAKHEADVTMTARVGNSA